MATDSLNQVEPGLWNQGCYFCDISGNLPLHMVCYSLGLALFVVSQDSWIDYISQQPGFFEAKSHPRNSLGSSNYDSAKLWLSLAVLILTATLFAAKVPGAPLVGIIFGTVVTWIEGWSRGVEGEGWRVFCTKKRI